MTSPARLPRIATLASATALCALLLAGCTAQAQTPTESAEPEASGAESASESAAFSPVTVDNCGTEITVDTPPERIVTVKSTTLELALALGLADRIVGSSYGDGPLPDNLAAAGEKIPEISPKLPSQEAVLTVDPDFIFGGWESNFSVDGVGERDTLHTLGITTYVAPSACKAPEYMPHPLTFDTVFDDFIEAGRIFGVEDAAEQLVDEQRAQLEALVPDAAGHTALWYSSGRDEPYVGAGIGAPAMLMEAAGLTNVFANEENTWISASWEKVADLNPDVIVLINSPGNTIDDKIELLTTNPVTSTMDAVINKRFVTLEFAEAEAGVRNVGSVAQLIEQLQTL
ncbi:putative F420-0 ABC transporter substrate-binding protein [Microbacterium sp. YY-01]|uniref:putative F420-0 ABC transporter substrate-binding protein n=1 Tax=Microbacterium sp. YY-01 TaxID=3421634 RepID=UPI003D16E17E